MIGEVEMENMYGTCRFCGQQKIVSAADQADADIKATNECTCPDAVLNKKRKRVTEYMQSICSGDDATEAKFQMFDSDQTHVAVNLAELIQLGKFLNAKIVSEDSVLKISLSKNKEVRISRERREKIEVEV